MMGKDPLSISRCARGCMEGRDRIPTARTGRLNQTRLPGRRGAVLQQLRAPDRNRSFLTGGRRFLWLTGLSIFEGKEERKKKVSRLARIRLPFSEWPAARSLPPEGIESLANLKDTLTLPHHRCHCSASSPPPAAHRSQLHNGSRHNEARYGAFSY